MATEHIPYEDTAAYEKEFESPSPLLDVAQQFDESGQPHDAQPWLEGAEDDAEEYLIDEELGGELEQAESTWSEVYDWWQSATPGQRHDFMSGLSVEQMQSLNAQAVQVQTEQKLGQLADFHDQRAAYQYERAQLAEQQQVETEARGEQVFQSMIEQARTESKTSATTEELDDWTHGWLDFSVHELIGQGYDMESVRAHVFSPENIEATVREVARESAAAESRSYALSHLKSRGPGSR